MEWKNIKQSEIQAPKLTGHTLISIPDTQNNDQIYIFGGVDENNQYSSNLYYFDPPTKDQVIDNKKTKPEPKGFCIVQAPNKKISPEARERHSLTCIGTNKAILFGGVQAQNISIKRFNDVWLLTVDKKKIIWIKPKINEGKGSPSERYDHSSTHSELGMIIFGGYDGKNVLDELWTLKTIPDEVDTFEWRRANLKGGPCARYGHAACLKNDKLYIYGGRNKKEIFNDLWCLQIHSGYWDLINQNGIIPLPRYGHSFIDLQNHFYLFGGRSVNGLYPNELYALDIEHYEWTKIIPVNIFGKKELIPKGRISHSCCLLNQDTLQILVIGGYCWNPETKFLTKEGDFITLDTFFNDEKKFQKIGNYKIEEYIGAGSFSTVYCVEGSNNELIALKRFRDTFGNSGILRELELIKKTEHTNLLPVDSIILEKKEVDTYINVIMPLAEMGDLIQYLNQSRQGLKEANMLHIILQILNGLSFLHHDSNKIVHRDLKPQNILCFKKQTKEDLKVSDFFKIHDDVVLKIADFGITKSLDPHIVRYFTSSQTFIAPEIQSDKGFSTASDMWSFGSILFFIITGYILDFKVEQNIQKISVIMKNTGHKNKDIYQNWIMMCINKDPESRITSETLFEIIKKTLEQLNPKLLIKIDRKKTNDSPPFATPLSGGSYDNKGSPSNRKKESSNNSFVYLKKPGFTYPNLIQKVNVSDINSWLNALGFDKYQENFKNAGFDQLEKLVGIEEKDVIEKLNIKLPGHVKKIIKKAKEVEMNEFKSVRIFKKNLKN